MCGGSGSGCALYLEKEDEEEKIVQTMAALAMAAKQKRYATGTRSREALGVWCTRSSAGTMAVAFMIIVSMQVGGGSADSTVQNLSKATMSVDAHVLAAGETLTIAMSSGDTATIDLSYTKNITGLKIQDAKEYFVVQNQAGTTASLAGQTVVTLDLVEAKVVEQAF